MKITVENLRARGYGDYEPLSPYKDKSILIKILSLGNIKVMFNGDSQIKVNSFFYNTNFYPASDTSEYVEFLQRHLEKQKRKFGEKPSNSIDFLEEVIKELKSYDIEDNDESLHEAGWGHPGMEAVSR